MGRGGGRARGGGEEVEEGGWVLHADPHRKENLPRGWGGREHRRRLPRIASARPSDTRGRPPCGCVLGKLPPTEAGGPPCGPPISGCRPAACSSCYRRSATRANRGDNKATSGQTLG